MEAEKELSFLEMIQLFNSQDIHYLIIGRRALILYGAPVMTADYDFWIYNADKVKTLTFLQNSGCELSKDIHTKSPIVFVFCGTKKYDLFFHKSITNSEGQIITFDECFTNSYIIESKKDSIHFRVPSIDDLIKLKKIRSYNAKDAQDIEFLLQAKKILNKKNT
ncbi:MAG: hypothetical protein AB1444_00525 [Spirochaetota bacterium]